MSEFIFPSDQDRADNDELDRVCTALEEVMGERDQLGDALEDITQAAQVEGLHMTGWADPVNKAASALAGAADGLSRRDARMKAEALEEAARTLAQPMQDGGYPWLVRSVDIVGMAAEYRKQAEGEA